MVNELAGNMLMRYEITVSAGCVNVSAGDLSVTVIKEVLVEAGRVIVLVLAGSNDTSKAVVVCPGS